MASADANKARKPHSINHAIERQLLKSRDLDESNHSTARSIALCILYGATSIAITFFNKAIFSVYAFPFPGFITLLQLIVGLTMLLVAFLTGYISGPPLSLELIDSVYPLSMCWWAYVVTGTYALRYLNIPMFSTLRKFTAIIVLILESVVLGKRAKPVIWLSILVMVAGGFVAGATDLSFSLVGYILVFICCLTTALYLILIVKVGKRSGLDTFGLLFYNNLLSLPLMLFYLIFFTTELSEIPDHPSIYDIKFWSFLFFSAALVTLLNVAIFLCTKFNSPLATTVTGQMKDVFTITIGLFVFKDVTLSIPNLIGLAVSMLGSFAYSVVKFLTA